MLYYLSLIDGQLRVCRNKVTYVEFTNRDQICCTRTPTGHSKQTCDFYFVNVKIFKYFLVEIYPSLVSFSLGLFLFNGGLEPRPAINLRCSQG